MSFQFKKIRKRKRFENINKFVKKIHFPPLSKNPLKKLKNIFSPITRLKNKKEKREKKSSAVGVVMVLIGIFVVYKIIFGVYTSIKEFNLHDLFYSIGTDLLKDEYGHTNFLILGTGGKNHEGPDLTDTIMIASFDVNTQSISLLSLPRDLYIQSNIYGSTRINEIYRNLKNQYIYKNNFSPEQASLKSLNILKSEVSSVSNLDIQYFIKINFRGFKDFINAIDGVDVDVKEDIVDNKYPGENWQYNPFIIHKGIQHLDGKTAIKYVRSRHSTSDFDRARRQQQVITAIRDKAMDAGILANPRKIKKLYSLLKENTETNLGLRELVTLAENAPEIKKERITSFVLNDNPESTGGFLYTPPRDLYGGAFVLIPLSGNYKEIHLFSDMIFSNREIFWENAKIEILNGTSSSGIATKLYQKFNLYGIPIAEVSNTLDREKYEKTQIFLYNQESPPSVIKVLSKFIKGKVSEGTGKYRGRGYDITIILGKDYIKHRD